MTTAIDPINNSTGGNVAAEMLVALHSRKAAIQTDTTDNAQPKSVGAVEATRTATDKSRQSDWILGSVQPRTTMTEQTKVLPPRPILEMAREAYAELQELMERIKTEKA